MSMVEEECLLLTHVTEYPTACSKAVGSAGRTLLYLPMQSMGLLIILWKETTSERLYRHNNGPCYERYVILTIGTPVLVCVFLLSFIPAFFGLLMYLCTCNARRKACYIRKEIRVKLQSEPAKNITLSILNSNTCLLPTYFAKLNNLGKTDHRAREICKVLLTHADCERDAENNANEEDYHNSGFNDFLPRDLSIVCLQEVFDRSAATIMRKGLLPHFASIAYMADGNSLRKPLGSGLFLAAKHNIMVAEFIPFHTYMGSDALADKGVMMIKIFIDRLAPRMNNGDINIERIAVAYAFITHLQAHAGTANNRVRCSQVGELKDAMVKFKETNTNSHEVTVLDFISGDLNTTWNEQLCLYDEYVDVCRECVHQWQPSSYPIGTELVQSHLYNEECVTPRNLRRVLTAGCDKPDGEINMLVGEGVGSQIDHILINKSVLESEVVKVRRYQYITAFAGLTDHLAVAVTVDLDLEKASTLNELPN